MKAIHKKRLLKCAQVTEDAKDFDMGVYFHECGAPGCALGNYAAATRFRIFKKPSSWTHWWFPRGTATRARDHFGISAAEEEELFSGTGCGFAGTDKQAAADYIRNFVKRKEAEK